MMHVFMMRSAKALTLPLLTVGIATAMVQEKKSSKGKGQSMKCIHSFFLS